VSTLRTKSKFPGRAASHDPTTYLIVRWQGTFLRASLYWTVSGFLRHADNPRFRWEGTPEIWLVDLVETTVQRMSIAEIRASNFARSAG
jgi:hypothetical protein